MDSASGYRDSNGKRQARGGNTRWRLAMLLVGVAAMAGILALGWTIGARRGNHFPTVKVNVADWPPASFTNGIGMQFVRVPAGEFVMGTTSGQLEAVLDRFRDGGDFPVLRDVPLVGQLSLKDMLNALETPAHRVRLTKTFLMGKHEVTVGQWRRFAQAARYVSRPEKAGGSVVWAYSKATKDRKACWSNPLFSQNEDHPVVCVTVPDVTEFIGWLNANDRSIPQGWIYSLPTEAQWEYAARGAGGLIYPWGNNWDGTLCSSGSRGDSALRAGQPPREPPKGTKPIGSFSPKGDGPFGLCDMVGNVAEWTRDFLSYQKGETTDPVGPVGGMAVARGGSWCEPQPFCRTASRRWTLDIRAENTIGFRVALIQCEGPHPNR